MKSPFATLALLGSLAGGTAWAQTAPRAAAPEQLPAAELNEGAVAPSTINAPTVTTVPEPTPVDELKAPTIALPDDPIEPYLLTKNDGPFMVNAKVFRGPDCQKMALALVKELRQEYHLPAYIFRIKDLPGRHLVRGIPPQADTSVVRASVKMPEKVRTYDEAAVLVGNAKTMKECEKLHHQVKKIKPRCLDGMSSIFPWKEGLSKATRTTNPYVAAQDLFQHKHDDLIPKMNTGAHSVVNCPGQYTLQIAEFSGRTTFDAKDENFRGLLKLRESPLRTAGDDAERLASKLEKDREFQKLGQPVYTYHDRTSSRVFIGSFQNDRDPTAVRVREALLRMAFPLTMKDRPGGPLDTLIVPATMLTDLTDVKAQFQK
jgi:hypothetical protein